MPSFHPHLLSSTFVLLLAAVGCSSESSSSQQDKQAPEAPQLAPPGKADAPGTHLTPVGTLSFGGEVFGEFTEDEQLDGYVFLAAAGAHVTLDNSNLGTSRNLDSTLFLYGPADEDGFYGAEPIASDDDSGWGTHARIKDFALPAGGQYLAVLGTYAGLDRGRYRLALECEQDSCVAACENECDDGDPNTTDTCDPVQGCLHESAAVVYGNVVLEGAGTQLVTNEDRQTATFSIRMNEQPTENTIIWIHTSDATEGEPHPTKVNFCKAGYYVGSNGCTENNEKVTGDPDEWKRTVPITVFGVRDAVDDGDVDYRVTLRIERGDLLSRAEELVDLPCVNQEGQTKVDHSGLEGLHDDDLLQAMFEMIRGNVTYGYQGQHSARNLMFSIIDNHDGLVESIYTGQAIGRPLDSTRAYLAGFNTEHTWPQSQFDKLEPMKSDLHHVFPSDISTNGWRSSYDFGWTTNPDSPNSVLGTSNSNAGKGVFQVRPETRGDVARAHFYMVARYKFDTEVGIRFDDDDSEQNGCIRDDEELVLREWNTLDPVDDRERDRNNRIEAYQGNRNPFVDDPALAERVSDF